MFYTHVCVCTYKQIHRLICVLYLFHTDTLQNVMLYKLDRALFS